MRDFYLFRKLCILSFSILLFGTVGNAQTSVCTNHSGANANYTVTFNVENTNATDIAVTDISAKISGGPAGTYTFTLLYNTSPISSTGSTWTQGTVGVGQNGWVQAGT